MVKTLLFAFLAILCSVSSAQHINPPTPGDIPGIRVVRSDTFSLQTLDKYDHSKRPLCEEFGLRKLYVIEYMLNDERARLEVFVMEDSPSAFGMFSLSNDTCMQRGVITALSCAGPGRVSVALGSMFLRAYTIGRPGHGQKLHAQIARQFVTINPQDSWYLPAIFRVGQLSPYTRSLKYFRGPTGVARGAPRLIELLEELSFECYTIDITAPSCHGILARITFPQLHLMDEFLVRAGMSPSITDAQVMTPNGAYRSWYKINETKMIFLECSSTELKLTDLIPDKPDINTWSIDH